MNWCACIKLDIQQDPCVGRMTLDILWQVDRGCQQFLDKFQFDPGRLLESKLWKFHACSFDFHQQWNNNQFVHRCIGVLDALLFQDGCHEYEVQMWPGKSHRVGSNYLFLIRYSSNGPNGVKLQSCRVAISQRVPKEVIGPVYRTYIEFQLYHMKRKVHCVRQNHKTHREWWYWPGLLRTT